MMKPSRYLYEEKGSIMVARVVSVHSAKGGSGKSTTALNVAYCLHAHGIKTGIIDLDPQGSIVTMRNSMMMFDDDFPFPVMDKTEQEGRVSRMDDDTVVLIDFPPNVHAETILDFSDVFIVPFQPSPLDWNSTIPGIEILRSAGKQVLPVLTRFKNREHTNTRLEIEKVIGSVDTIFERAYYVRCAIVNGGVWQDGVERLARTESGEIVKATVRQNARAEIKRIAQHLLATLHEKQPFKDEHILQFMKDDNNDEE